MLYKGAAVAGGIGTVGGVTGVAVLANKDSTNKEQLKKQIEEAAQKEELKNFLESFSIKPETQKGLFKTIEDKTKDFWKDGKADISKIVSAIEGLGESQLKGKETQLKTQLKTKITGKNNREEIEKQDLKDVIEALGKEATLKDWKELKEITGDSTGRKNNLCEVVQKELFRRLAESEFKLEIEKKAEQTEGFISVINACLTSKN